MGWWIERLQERGVEIEGPYARFDEEALDVIDPDGLKLELVAHAGSGGSGRLRDAGADVTLAWQSAGHGLTSEDIRLAKEWLA